MIESDKLSIGNKYDHNEDFIRAVVKVQQGHEVSLSNDDEAKAIQGWADKLGIDRSELLRTALHRHLIRLASIEDAKTWEQMPLTEDEQSLFEVNDWGVAEDWSDWK